MDDRFECRKCAADFYPERGSVWVCDDCFEELTNAGYTLDEMFDAYPPLDDGWDDCDVDDVDPTGGEDGG